MGWPSSANIGSMNASDSVVGCSTCGALYTPVAGDDGVCPTCTSLRPSQQATRPARPAAPNLRPVPRRMPEEDTFEVDDDDAPAPRRRGGRSLRPIIFGTAAAILVAGICTAIVMRPRPLTEAWSAIRRHSPSPSHAWVAVRRYASDAWASVMRHLPFDKQSERSASAPPPAKDATASQGTHRRPHGKGKRNSDD
jgi:hypothetical protein